LVSDPFFLSFFLCYDYTGARVEKSGSLGTTYLPFAGYEVQGATVTKYIRIGNEVKKGSTGRRGDPSVACNLNPQTISIEVGKMDTGGS